jgi:hypothetical protein
LSPRIEGDGFDSPDNQGSTYRPLCFWATTYKNERKPTMKKDVVGVKGSENPTDVTGLRKFAILMNYRLLKGNLRRFGIDLLIEEQKFCIKPSVGIKTSKTEEVLKFLEDWRKGQSTN